MKFRRRKRKSSGVWATMLALLTTLMLAQPAITGASLVTRLPDDGYELEHEVPAHRALAKAKHLQLYPGPIPGCKQCTREEMTYCQDGSVLQDHCCCDAGYNEVLEFVEHTCRVGPEACQVRAGDCAEYTRLRECCCHSYLASLWKYLAGGSAALRTSYLLLGSSLFLMLLRMVVR